MIRTFSEIILAIGSSTELSFVVKATVVLVLGLAGVRMARAARASVRHILLTATFLVLLALPLAMALFPVVRFEIPTVAAPSSASAPAVVTDQAVAIAQQPTAAVASNSVASTEWISNSRQLLLPAILAIGAVLFLAPFARALWRLRQARRNAVPWLEARATLRALADDADIRRPIEVLIHDGIPAPVTCGWLRPAILLPAEAREWNDFDIRRAFTHELEHIRRGDWTVHIMARAICGVYWFHPLVWVAWRQLSLEAERACDDAVLQGAERADYAQQLVSLAGRLSKMVAPPALSMANRSDLSVRVTAILDGKQSRGRAGGLVLTGTLLAAAAMVLAIAPVQAVAMRNQDKNVSSSSQKSEAIASPLNRALLEASEADEVPEMIRLLDAGADVNAAIDGDGSPLIAAAREGRLSSVKLLLERGANPNLGVPGDGNALIMAAREGHENVVTLLLDSGASIDLVVPEDENALIQASGNGQLAVAKLLVSRGADVNARVWVDAGRGDESKGEWRTPLNMAQRGGHKAVVDFLLSAGASKD